jgi:hypothetical protein
MEGEEVSQGWKNIEEFFSGAPGAKKAKKLVAFLGMLKQ